jgi:hypothetical protein
MKLKLPDRGQKIHLCLEARVVEWIGRLGMVALASPTILVISGAAVSETLVTVMYVGPASAAIGALGAILATAGGTPGPVQTEIVNTPENAVPTDPQPPEK